MRLPFICFNSNQRTSEFSISSITLGSPRGQRPGGQASGFGAIYMLLWLCLTLTALNGQAQCPTGYVTLTSQAQVDAFPAGCTNILGTLVISGADITSLTALSHINSVGGTLSIQNNPNLPTLTGLNQLTSVGLFEFAESLTIANNPSLTSVSGLSGLRQIGGSLNFITNEALPSLSGLESLTSVGDGLFIQRNPSLTSVSGLSGLRQLRDRLEISDNGSLPSLSGLESITSVGGNLNVSINPSLTSVNGLSGLRQVGATLVIFRNEALPNLSGLESLTNVGGGLRILTNSSLTSISSLNGLRQVGDLLQVYENSSLPSLSGLESITSVGGTLRIGVNPSLTSVSGLSGLKQVGDRLEISYNEALPSLSGLESITSVGGDLNIQGNPRLATCAIASICRLLATPPPGGITISGNATGCASVAEVQAICSPLAIMGFAASPNVVCVGSPVTFTTTATNAATPYNYTLTNGSSTTIGTASTITFSQSLVASGSGSQSFTLTVSSGGQTASATTTVTVNALPVVTISPASTTVNSGETVTLTAKGASTYTWSTGATTNPISFAASPGTTPYSVTGVDANGCSAIASATVTATSVSLLLRSPSSLCVKAAPPAKALVTLPLTMTLTGGVGPYTYSWAYKSPSSGYKAIPSGGTTIGKVSFTPVSGRPSLTISGEKGNLNGLQGYVIQLTVTDSNGKTATATTLLDGSCSLSGARQGVEETRVQVQVWPNPMQDVLQLQVNGLTLPAQVMLYDMRGRPAGTWRIEPQAGAGQLKAPVDHLPEGIYILRVATEEGVLHSERLLKQR